MPVDKNYKLAADDANAVILLTDPERRNWVVGGPSPDPMPKLRHDATFDSQV
jgi:hypothetical protein